MNYNIEDMTEKITQAILDGLTEKAKVSPRLRANLDLRDSDADTSQRMLNAIEPESVVPIHKHQKTSETVVCLRGRLVEEFFAEQSGRSTFGRLQGKKAERTIKSF